MAAILPRPWGVDYSIIYTVFLANMITFEHVANKSIVVGLDVNNAVHINMSIM